MPYNVLVVDDSSFFQIRLKEIINEHPELNVIGVAANGQEAIDLAAELKPDIISMDYEMPFLDGVSAVKAIMAARPVPIVMFSSMTYEGARITLEALDAGAVDFIPKNFAEVSRKSASLKKKLQETLLAFARKAKPIVRAAPVAQEPKTPAPKVVKRQIDPVSPKEIAAPIRSQPRVPKVNLRSKVKLVVIGASTGGPVALTEVVQNLSANFPVPVIVVQHMPENFTKALAERLNKQCAIRVMEAGNGDSLQAGHVYIAPGGHQLILSGRGTLKVLPGDERLNYKPSVDITFASAASQFSGAVLGIILTGMGADGCEGARLLKQHGAVIWGQDQASCVVYGMPKAIAVAGLTDEVLPLTQIGLRLARDFEGGLT